MRPDLPSRADCAPTALAPTKPNRPEVICHLMNDDDLSHASYMIRVVWGFNETNIGTVYCEPYLQTNGPGHRL